MNKSMKYFIMLFILLTFTMSCAYAANETQVTDTTDIETNTVQDNTITKAQTAQTKTATTEVTSYDSLVNELTDTEDNKTINIKKGTYKITNPITTRNTGKAKSITINGNGATIDGSNTQSFLTISPNNIVTINDLIIKNTKATSQASAIITQNNVVLTLNNCTFINNVASGKGGAITNRGTAIIKNSVFTQNTAAQGGAIWSTGEYGGSIQITDSKFTNNKASDTNNYDRTGVIYLVSGGKNTISSNTFENNNGRSIHNLNTTLTVSQNKFINTQLNAPNTSIRGAVIDNYEANINITDNIFNNITVNSENLRGGILYNEIGKSTFSNNKITNTKVSTTGKTDSLNGGVLFNRNSTLTVSNNQFDNTNKADKIHGGALYNNIGILNVTQNTFNTVNTATETRGGAIYNDKTGNTNSVLYHAANEYKTTNTGSVINQTIYNLGTIKETQVKITPVATIVTVNQVFGVVGDNITFIANVKDIKQNPVTGGNLVFKLNGRTLKTDGSFDSSAPSNKVSVKDGVAKITVVATKDIRGAKNISASYSGSSNYLANTTQGITTAEIALRKAAITVTATPTTQKQYETIRFTAKVSDVTKNTKISTPENNNQSYVFFKINGVTLKDANGKQIQAKVNNGVATYDYVVPAGMAAINKDKTTRYYNVTAGFASPVYYPDTKNVTKFNVQRSDVTITTSKVIVNTTSKKLQIKGTIKDYKDNYVIGKNLLNVKINGKTVTINNQTTTEIIDGIITLTVDIPTNIQVVRNITLVTGARTAYEGYRTTISSITTV